MSSTNIVNDESPDKLAVPEKREIQPSAILFKSSSTNIDNDGSPNKLAAEPNKREIKFIIQPAATSSFVLKDFVPKESGPPRYGLFSLVVNNYWIAFAVVLALELLGIFLSYIFVLQNPNKSLFPMDFKGVPIDLKEDPTYKRLAAFDSLKQETPIVKQEEYVKVLPTSKPASSLSIIYTGDNVLSKECLTAIDDVERWLTSSKMWEHVAVTDASGVILKPTSVLRYFDGTYGANLNDTEFASIPKTINAAYNNSKLKEGVEKLISKDAVISQTEAKSTLTRSIFKTFTNRYPGMSNVNYWEYALGDKLVKLAAEGRAGMKINYINPEMMGVSLMNKVEKDMFLAGGSLLFILFFVFLQTQSIFITVFGITSIILSFIWTNYIYRVIFGHHYFGIFHGMSIFIILGIGTDDLFVFYDMWRTTACMDLNTVEKRFAFSYRHASMSMLITSLTTAVAFATNVFTPLYGISSFATFTTILVIVNYISAVSFFPMCVLVYHYNIAWCPWPWQFFYNTPPPDPTKALQPNFIVRFFKGPFYSCITHKVFKWVFIVCCTGNGVFFAFMAYRLEISEKNLQYFTKGHNYHDAMNLEQSGFKRASFDARLQVSIVFGIKEQDFSKCDALDYKCTGRFEFDAALDLNPIPTQIALLNACSMLKKLDGHQDLHLARNETTKNIEALCFLDNMNEFFKKHGLDSSFFNRSVNLSLPVSGIKFMHIARVRQDLYAAQISSGNFYRFFETALSYWLTNAYRGDHTTGVNFTSDLMFSGLLGLYRSEDSAAILNSQTALYGAQLKYFIIPVTTNLMKGSITFEEGLAAYDAWENFTKSWMSTMPASVQGFQMTTKDGWHQFKMSKVLQESAVRGIILGTILAFVVLVIATNNIIISLMATLNIMLVVATFAGLIHLLGIKISVIESMNLSLVAGLSVDYVVHLSESYNHAPHTGRKRKTRDMLEQMGVSVLSGSVTTSGAASFMLCSTVYFFFQFGLFIMLTILLSLFYSLLWFTPLLSVIGPEGDVGSLSPVFQWVKNLLKPIRDELAADEEIRKMSYSRSISA